MRGLIFIVFFLKLLFCKSQNAAELIIPIASNQRNAPLSFYDSSICDTLRGFIVLEVRFNTRFGDTITELTAKKIELIFFRLQNSQHTILDIRGNQSEVSELGFEELRLFNTYSEKIINLYWAQPYNKFKDDLSEEYGKNISALSCGGSFVIIPKKEDD